MNLFGDYDLSADGRIAWIEDYLFVPTTGAPMRLAQFQKDFIHTLYTPDVLDAYLSISRGNAKTSLLAAIALAELYLNPAVPVVALYAPFVDMANQSDGIFGACALMISWSDVLSDAKLTKVSANNNKSGIFTTHNKGTCKVVPVRSSGRLVGGAPTLAVCDEAAREEWTIEKLANIKQGLGKRPGAKAVLISTPGPDGNPFVQMRDAIIRDGLPQGTAWVEYSASDTDDFSSEEVWRKVNPAIDAGFLDIEVVRKEFSRPDIPMWLFQKMRLGMHTVTDVSGGWLGIEGALAWDKTELEHVTFDLDSPIYVGVDKSARWDCSAVVALQRDGDNWYAKAEVFVPDTINGRYQIDHKAILAYLRELWQDYPNIEAIAFDERYFIEGAQELEDEGLPMLMVPQTENHMGPAYSYLYKAIMSETFFHEHDEVYRSHVLSAVAKPTTDNQSIMLSKNRTQQRKIDAVVATALAMSASGLTRVHDFRLYY